MKSLCLRLAAVYGWLTPTALIHAGGNLAHAESYGTAPYGMDRQHPFIESMQLMMDAMGMNRGGSDVPGNLGDPFGGGWAGSGRGPSSGSSWGQGVPRGFESLAPQRWIQQFGSQSPQNYTDPRRWPRQMQSMWSAIRALDGDWRGRGGEVLSIRGDRFRIYASRDNYADGRLQIDGSYLILHNAGSRRARRYEFAVYQGRLALRDESGQLLLYRRVDPKDSYPPHDPSG